MTCQRLKIREGNRFSCKEETETPILLLHCSSNSRARLSCYLR